MSGLPAFADDDDGAVRVAHAVLAHRADAEADEPARAAGAEDEHVRGVRPGEQNLGGISLLDSADELHRRFTAEDLRDRVLQRPLGSLPLLGRVGKAPGLERVARRQTHERELPGGDDLELRIPQLRLLGRPAKGRA